MAIKKLVMDTLYAASGAPVYNVRLPVKLERTDYPAISVKTVRSRYPNSRDKTAPTTKRYRMEAHIWTVGEDEDAARSNGDELADKCEAGLRTADDLWVYLDDRDDYYYTEVDRYTVRLQFYAWQDD